MRIHFLVSVAVLGACALQADPDPCALPPGTLSVEDTLVSTGWKVELRSSGEAAACAPWSIVRKPARSSARIESVSARASFVPDVPGIYEVGLLHPDWSRTVEVEAVAPTVDLEPLAPFDDVTCDDAVLVGGRLACIGNGVRIVDHDGRVLSESTVRRPLNWGVDASGDLVATASTGCPACSSGAFPGCCDSEIPPALDLYRISASGELQPVWSLDVAADEVSLSDGHLAVSTSGRTTLYDVSEPAAPQAIGCIGSGGFPLLAEGRLWLLDHGLREWALPSDPESCDETPLATAGTHGTRLEGLGLGDLARGAGVTFAATGALEAFATVDGGVEAVWSEPRIAAWRLALASDRLFVRTQTRLYVFDVSEPRSPRLAAMTTHRTGGLGSVVALADEVLVTGGSGVERFALH